MNLNICSCRKMFIQWASTHGCGTMWCSSMIERPNDVAAQPLTVGFPTPTTGTQTWTQINDRAKKWHRTQGSWYILQLTPLLVPITDPSFLTALLLCPKEGSTGLAFPEILTLASLPGKLEAALWWSWSQRQRPDLVGGPAVAAVPASPAPHAFYPSSFQGLSRSWQELSLWPGHPS